MKRAWVLFRNGRPGTFAYDTKEAASRVASKGHEVVELVDLSAVVDILTDLSSRRLLDVEAAVEAIRARASR